MKTKLQAFASWPPSILETKKIICISFILVFSQSAGATNTTLADIIESSRDAVVQIQVNRIPPQIKNYQHRPNFQGFYDRRSKGHYGPQSPNFNRPPPLGVGSGFLVNSDGLIVTNAHVVHQATTIKAMFSDASTRPAKIIGVDPVSDLAVLKVQGSGFSHVNFGDSDKVRIGDSIIAIGSPFGLIGTATSGIVSAKNRNLKIGKYDNYLQIDAPINSGNSGGPILNMRGEVVAVSTAIYSPNGGNIGIGFAIPSTDVERIIQDLVDFGHVSRGYLGIKTQSLSPDLAEALKLTSQQGALVTDIQKGTAAEKGKMMIGDVIISFSGKKIDGPTSLARLVALAKPNHSYNLTVVRNGKKKTLFVNLHDQSRLSTLQREADRLSKGEHTFGLRLSDLTTSLRGKLNLDSNIVGVVVTKVKAASVAEQAGLMPGDLILKVNDVTISSTDQWTQLIRSNKKSTVSLLLVLREDRQFFTGLKTIV